jgi:hypothetical protein
MNGIVGGLVKDQYRTLYWKNFTKSAGQFLNFFMSLKEKKREIVSLIIETYLGYKTRFYKFFGFGLGQLFMRFSLFSMFSVYAESTFKVKSYQKI